MIGFIDHYIEELSAITKLPDDQLRYFIAFFAQIPFCFLCRLLPNNVMLKHSLYGILGILFFITQKAANLCILFNFIFLTILSVYKTYTYYLIWRLTIQTVQMIMLIKLCVDSTQKSAYHKKYRISPENFPSILEYFGYVFFFPAYFCGPCIEYITYKQFVDMSLFEDNNRKLPSFSYKIFFKSLLASLILFWNYNSECFGIAMGFSYTGRKDNEDTYDGFSNVDLKGFFLSTSVKVEIDSWNTYVQSFMKNHVFEAFESMGGFASENKQFLTNLTSAFWHGLYPGYYLSFGMLAIHRDVSYYFYTFIEPKVLEKYGNNSWQWYLYYAANFFYSRFVAVYCFVPFLLLTFTASMKFFLNTYFCLHVVGVILLIVLKQHFKKEKKN
ncbi:Membrane-bound O-acyltransferase (MBOAT) family protein [Entamoeba marina]